MTYRARVLIDTNILFSRIIFSGPEARLLDLARSGAILLLVPDFVIAELREVISRKMPEFSEILEEFLRKDYIVRLPPPPYNLVLKAQNMIRDPKDSIILASALDARPDYVVSGDKDFHTPEIKTTIPVISAREIIQRYIS